MPHFVEVPEYGEVEFPDDMSNEDISSAISRLSKTQGGESTNEYKIPASPEGPRQDRNAQDGATIPVQTGTQQGLQTNRVLPAQDQSQLRGDDQADLTTTTDEGQTQDAQGGIQGTQERKGLRGQVPAGQQEKVREQGVQPPKQGFFEEIQTPEGKKALAVTAIEEFIPAAIGSVAGEIVGTAAAVASVPFVGPAAPLVGLGVGSAAFLGTQELAKKILVNPLENVLGIKKDIEEIQAAAPSSTEAGGYVGMAPFAIKSLAGFARTGLEAAAKAAEGEAVKDVTKAISKEAASAFSGGLAFEPIRYGFEAAEEGLGITEEAPKPITLKSELESGLMGVVLGGGSKKEKLKTDIGEEIIEQADLPETAKVAASVKTDSAIEASEKAKQVEFVDPNETTELLYKEAERVAESGDVNATEQAIKVAEDQAALEATPASDWIVANRQARADAIREKLTAKEEPVTETTAATEEVVSEEAPAAEGELYIEPTDDRIGAAAFRIFDPNEGKVRLFFGENHEEAMKNAALDGLISMKDVIRGEERRSERETDQFGFITNNGKFVSRQEAEAIAQKAGQLKPEGKQSELLHSNEVQLDYFENRQKFGPGASAAKQFEAEDIKTGAKILRGAFEGKIELSKEEWIKQMEQATYEDKYTPEKWGELYDKTKEAFNRWRESTNSKFTRPIESVVEGLEKPEQPVQSFTSIKNEQIDRERAARGLPPLMNELKRSRADVWNSLMQKIEKDENYASSEIERIKKNPAGVSDEGSLLLTHQLVNIKNETAKVMDEINSGKLSGDKLTEKQEQLRLLDDQYLEITNLTKKTGTETARALSIRQAVMAEDNSLQNMKYRKRAENGGRQLTKEEVDKITEQNKKIEKAQKKLDEKIKSKKTEDQSKDISDFIEKTASESKRKKVSDMTPDERIARYTDQIKARKADPASLGSSIRQLAKSFIEKGVTDREQLLDSVHNVVSRQVGEGWTKDQTMDAISGYGKFHQMTKDAITETLRTLGGEYLQLGKRRDILEGKAPLKTGAERRKIGLVERNLIAENNRLIRKNNIQVTDPVTQLNGAMEGIKRRLENEIEDLNARIASGEQKMAREKREISPEDPLGSEILQLREERDSLKKQFTDTWGKPSRKELTMEEKVASAEKSLDRLIAKRTKELEQLKAGVNPEAPREKVTSEKIEHQKAILDELNAEKKAIRDADMVRKAEQEELRIARRIDEITGILSGKAEPEKKKPLTFEQNKELRQQLSVLEKQLKEFRDAKVVKKSEAQKEIERLQKQLDDANDRIARGEKQAPTAKKEPLTEYAKRLREDIAKAQKKYQELVKPPAKSAEEIKLDQLNRQKTASEERLARLQSGEKKVTGKDQSVLNKEQQAVKDEINSLNDQIKQYEEALRKTKSPEEIREASIQRRIDAINKQLKEGAIEEKKKVTREDTENEKRLLKELEDLQKKRSEAPWFVARREASALSAYRANVARRIAEYKRKSSEKDFAPKVKKERVFDEETQKLRDELARAKDEYEQDLINDRWLNASKEEKVLRSITGWKRFSVLSYLSTITKLFSASNEVAAKQPVDIFIGTVLNKIPVINSIAKLAPIEGGHGKFSEQVLSYADGLGKGAKEMWGISKGGRSFLDLKFEKGSKIPVGILGRPGKIHEAIKNPTLRANYELGLKRYLAWAEKQGPIDEAVLRQAEISAYKYAQRQIFKEDNALVNLYNTYVNIAKQSKTAGIRRLGYIADEFLPIIRIPTNFIKQGIEYQLGTITGTKNLIKALNKGLENVTADEAETIMRQLKSGSAGLFLMALGSAFADNIGGFHRKGQLQPDDDEPPIEGLRLWDMNVPKLFLDHPMLLNLQIGATVRKFWEDEVEAEMGASDQSKLVAKAIAEAEMGLFSESPFIELFKETGKMFDLSRIEENAGELARSNIPGFIQEIAKAMDVEEEGLAPKLKTLIGNKSSVTKRKAEDFWQHIEMGLPILRQEVPEK